MPLCKLEELVAYQLSMELKAEVLTLLYNSPAQRDVKLASQISEAVCSLPSNLAEGYYRFNPAEFATFVKYCRSSLQEVRRARSIRSWRKQSAWRKCWEVCISVCESKPRRNGRSAARRCDVAVVGA